MENTDKTLREIIGRIAETTTDFSPEADFREELGLDSHLGLELIFELERVFKIRIPEARIPELRTLRRTTDLVTSLQSAT